MPAISVIIPMYNCASYIERCAKSLLSQTLQEVEFIFIDDCSEDNSVNILNNVIEKNYSHRKRDIRILSTTNNSGQAIVRKLGIESATGDYIIHCDSDDWFETNAFAIMYEVATENNADVVICDHNEVGIKTRRVKNCYDVNKNAIIRDLLESKISCAVWNKLVARRLFSNEFIYPTANNGEDLLIVTQCIYKANTICYVDEPLYNYNIQSTTSITAAKGLKISIYKFNQLYQNIALLDSFWNFVKCYDYKESMLSLKNKKREIIAPYTDSNEVYQLWLCKDLNINCKVLFSDRISFLDKIRFILVYFKLWPLWKRISKRKAY